MLEDSPLISSTPRHFSGISFFRGLDAFFFILVPDFSACLFFFNGIVRFKRALLVREIQYRCLSPSVGFFTRYAPAQLASNPWREDGLRLPLLPSRLFAIHFLYPFVAFVLFVLLTDFFRHEGICLFLPLFSLPVGIPPKPKSSFLFFALCSSFFLFLYPLRHFASVSYRFPLSRRLHGRIHSLHWATVSPFSALPP